MAERGLTNDVRTDEDVTFADLAISESTINSLSKAGFIKPSPIQLQALPLALVGLDLLVQAKSGTGKTLVFSITALEFVQNFDIYINHYMKLVRFSFINYHLSLVFTN